MHYDIFNSPIGPLLVAGDSVGLREIRFEMPDRPALPEPDWLRDGGALGPVLEQLHEYFAGTRQQFELRVSPQGTEFQQGVWRLLQQVPFGTTTTYGTLAEQLGMRHGARAVGLANGSNPVPIVIPCHRVVGSDGSLTGFGGGLERKRYLLSLEGVALEADRQRALF